MSPAHVLAPTYDAIRIRLLEGYWPMGGRLEAVKLADDLGVSMTPVRDSLNRLFGEHLVDFVPGEGFRVPHLKEARLRDLLDLNRILLMAAISGTRITAFQAAPVAYSIAERTAVMFNQLAGQSGNSALVSCVTDISNQLHRIRNSDAAIIHDVDQELSALGSELERGSANRALLKTLIQGYHIRRIEAVSQYIQLLS